MVVNSYLVLQNSKLHNNIIGTVVEVLNELKFVYRARHEHSYTLTFVCFIFLHCAYLMKVIPEISRTHCLMSTFLLPDELVVDTELLVNKVL